MGRMQRRHGSSAKMAPADEQGGGPADPKANLAQMLGEMAFEDEEASSASHVEEKKNDIASTSPPGKASFLPLNDQAATEVGEEEDGILGMQLSQDCALNLAPSSSDDDEGSIDLLGDANASQDGGQAPPCSDDDESINMLGDVNDLKDDAGHSTLSDHDGRGDCAWGWGSTASLKPQFIENPYQDGIVAARANRRPSVKTWLKEQSQEGKVGVPLLDEDQADLNRRSSEASSRSAPSAPFRVKPPAGQAEEKGEGFRSRRRGMSIVPGGQTQKQMSMIFEGDDEPCAARHGEEKQRDDPPRKPPRRSSIDSAANSLGSRPRYIECPHQDGHHAARVNRRSSLNSVVSNLSHAEAPSRHVEGAPRDGITAGGAAARASETDQIEPSGILKRSTSQGTHRSRSKGSKKQVKVTCPYFSGAAAKNAALFARSSQSTSASSKRTSSLSLMINDNDMKTLQELGSSFGDLDFTTEYSYTTPSNEFKKKLKEEDLFGKPSTDGFFTREEGILMPDYQRRLEALERCRGRTWYTVGCRMRGLVACNGLIKVIDEMEIIEGDERACPDESLQLASSILGCLTYGYRSACWRNNINYEPAPALQIPWQMICKRLGRRDAYFAVEDFIYNFKPLSGNSFVFDNMDQLTAMSGSGAEDLMGKLFCESNAYLKNMLPSILALCRGEWDSSHISRMIHEVKELNRMMGKAVPDVAAGEKSIDPVEFATAFANYTSPLKDDVPALSGGGLLIFVCMDHIVGRKKFDSAMGIDVMTHLDWMPLNWRRFVEYLRQRQVFNHVPKELQYLWVLLKDVYLGERGWLGRHKYRAYQFVELSGALGRASNKGSLAGAGALEMLEEARLERDPNFSDDRGSYKTCRFKGKIKSVSRVSEDRLTQLVTIESYKPLDLCVGDHIAIVMRNHDGALWRFSVQHSLDLHAQICIKDGSLTQEWQERLDFGNLLYTVYNVLLCAKLPKSTDTQLHVGNVCQILHPEEPRLYSYATIGTTEGYSERIVTSVDLLVTNTGLGGCSNFLFRSVGEEISFGISMAAKFHIPKCPIRPIVVIAAGSGLGTYLPLLVNTDFANPKYAFLAFRTECTVPYLEQHLKKEVIFGRLHLYVELSREDHTLITEDRQILRQQTSRRYINALMLEQAHLIRELAATLDEGGMEAYFYVCGNSDFFKTVRGAMDSIDHGLVSRLVESNRLHLEVQARGGIDGKSRTKPIKMSEICFHNKMDDFWVAIHGAVYSFTDYLPWHPGGRKILHYVAGTDATVQWDLVKHDRDRMIFSQIPSFQIGSFDSSDPLGLNDLLDAITRTENCVNLYEERGDMFEKLYDGYLKVQAIFERVIGKEFLELLFRLIHDDGVRFNVLRRLWLAKNGRTRDLADNMYKVAPMKEKKRESAFDHQSRGYGALLRPANLEERSRLHDRLVEACDLFFLRCKKAIANFDETTTKNPNDNHDVLCSKMFFRLTMAYESLYASLSQPLPLDSIRKWDVLRVEALSRKTFAMRFNSWPLTLPKDFAHLCSQTPPGDSTDLDSFFDNLLAYLDAQKKTLADLTDAGLQTDIVNDWFDYKQERQLFNRLDSDNDGLIGRRDVIGLSLEHAADCDIDIITRFLRSDKGKRETYTFLDFLEVVEPNVAKKRGLRRFTAAFKRGHSKSNLLISAV